jgi:signal transduction histidine kinase
MAIDIDGVIRRMASRVGDNLGVSRSLSSRLLLLTILFVMLAEILIFVPSISNFRRNWLQERLNAAQIAALSAKAAPDRQIPALLRDELLRSARVHAVALKHDGKRVLVLEADMPERVDAHYNLQKGNWLELMSDALQTFISSHDRIIRVQGKPNLRGSDFIEIVIDEKPLKEAMIGFSRNIAIMSLLISAFTATLVYLALRALLVKPMQELSRSIVRFARNPEDARNIIRPSGRLDEIGLAEKELAGMQEQLSLALRQKNHLAALGLAVSKINHDLRNMLANAQLISDHLGSIDEPTVQRLTPRLISSLDRAIKLCSDTLHYGRAREKLPEIGEFAISPLLDEIAGEQGLPILGEIEWRNEIGPDFRIRADRDQIYRVFANLVRNALQAIEAHRRNLPSECPADEILVTASRSDGKNIINICDSGPGVEKKVRQHLFEAFRGSSGKRGSGLGLAISREIILAHGGDISLLDGPRTCFRIILFDEDNGAP